MTGNLVFGDIVQIAHVGGDVTIVSRQPPPYRVVPADDRPVPVSADRARAQPSRLLLARHQIVPFTGRQRTLDSLATWSDGSEPVAARLIHAPGGQGKTRLAGHVGVLAAAAGCAVWQVTHTPALAAGADAGGVSRVGVPAGAVLVVVDYADRWPASALLALLTQMHDLHQTLRARIRVLLLARSDGYWWPAVADRADSDLGIDVDQMSLPPLAADSLDDWPGLFTTAAGRFADAMNLPAPAGGWPVPPPSGPGYGQVLAVHMAALATVDAHRHGRQAPTDPAAVSTYLLRREQAYWQHLHTRPEAPVPTRPELMHRVVFTATLTGARPRPVARQALTCAGFTDTENPVDRVIDDHTVCYPPADGRTVFEPVHPDRLGEDLIALSIPDGQNAENRLARDWAPGAVTGLLTTALPEPPVWTAAAVTTLVEAARRWPHLAEQMLYPLIRTHPHLIIAAGGATLTRLTGIPGLDPAVLEPLEPLLPANRHIDLDIAAAITTTLTTHRLTHTTDPAEQARLHATHAFRLANAGRREQALARAEEATVIYRRLAEANPDACLPDLAMSLNNLGNRLSELGLREQALARAEEATVIYRRLAEANPDACLPDLAMSLNNLGNRLSELGLREQALARAEEATVIYRRLAEANPDACLPDLAMSLNNLGNRLSELGLREQALARAEEATVIYRRLAEANPDAYLPDLAASLNNLGNRLSELGRREQALTVAEEAVTIRRGLAEANPDAYLPDLAVSLNNLGIFLSGLGRREQALARAEEAATIRRGLAEANPDAYLPDLAVSLNNLGIFLSGLGRREQALARAEEAATIRRGLAEANPDAYLPDLAVSLNNLGIFLSGLGRREQALAPAEEATVIYRRLAEANPDAYLPDLAMSLNNLGAFLSELGRREQALAQAEEATVIYRRLAEANPDAYLPDLAASLNNLGNRLSELGRREQALARAEEAVTIRRGLAEANPDAYLPDLAASLHNLGAFLSELGRREQALAQAEEATVIYRRLAEANPDAYLPDLAASLNNLGNHLSELGRREQALARAEEAVTIRRGLAEANPDAYLPDLAASLHNLGTFLSGLGRREQALARAEEAVTIRRGLAEANPDAYLPDLAMSLRAYGWVCVNVKANYAQALESVTEAIGLFEPLTEQLPDVFAGQLISAYRTLADVLDGLGRADEATDLRRQLDQLAGHGRAS
ncbi:tetratricopeptide repeat protein [Actinoplanes lobatus]|uniref:Tetratricopeptide (TPR) repeat protein n=1 Tax=Actinoplanes lobatus TaxID=113568 RepID=A0A7W7MJX2_9ACTN|nr:tetratricopeptide repeat protein [Actinoplanes lobatus]MBB4752791.1 tetratricopeptide (TPR) repeat protein [Actinoplanes lobatus]